MKEKRTHSGGFTLVELIMTVFISSLLMATVYTAYLSQQKIQSVQDQVVEMQQNLRAGRDMLFREIKMAGYDPRGDADAGITAAFPDVFAFSMDLNNNGDTNTAVDTGENIAYSIYEDGGDINLGRTSDNSEISTNSGNINLVSGTHREVNNQQPAAQHIESLEFLYTMADDSTTTQPDPADYDEIVAVTVTMVARAPFPDEDFTNNRVYTAASGGNLVLSGANPPNDNYRRRMVSHTIKLRNLGL